MASDPPTCLEPDELAGRAETAVAQLAGALSAVLRCTMAASTGAGHAEERRAEALRRLRALAYLGQAVERCAQQEAEAAARAGAGYPQLGRAWGITRQGARKRWPGLVFTADPPSRPLILPDRRKTDMTTPAPAGPYSVLLVEDDLADVMLIEDALADRGLARSVTHVGDGIAALEHLRDPDRARPDLIVLDLNMPRMNGRELLAVLKADPQLGSIPVVVLTTSAAPDDVHDAYRQHANAYVTKPVNFDDFIHAVQSIDAFFLDTATRPARP